MRSEMIMDEIIGSFMGYECLKVLKIDCRKRSLFKNWRWSNYAQKKRRCKTRTSFGFEIVRLDSSECPGNEPYP